MKTELIDNFIMHPDWKQMEAFIKEHFEKSMDVSDIDTTNSSSVIHAEVIARQKIAVDVESLLASFDTYRKQRNKSKISYE